MRIAKELLNFATNMERTRGEIILFVMTVLGIWISIWAVLLVSAKLECLAVGLSLAGLLGFAARNNN